jgi:hypothetical protein
LFSETARCEERAEDLAGFEGSTRPGEPNLEIESSWCELASNYDLPLDRNAALVNLVIKASLSVIVLG